ncbi:MAG: type II secretion system protein [Candidatus Omnitrophota bacterium]
MGRKTVILRSQKGFALLEIFLDLAIVAVCLGVMAAYQYLAVKKSNIKIVERELAMLNAGAVSFAEHRSPKAYPPTTKTICVDFFLRERPQIVRRVLEDPLSKTKEEYHYARSPNGLYYCFWSVGDNSVSDTEGIDDNGNIIKNKASDDIYLTSLY